MISRMNLVLTTAVVLLFFVVTGLALAAAGGAPVTNAVRNGDIAGRICVFILVAIDFATLVHGHDSPELKTHIAYAIAALAIAPLVALPKLGQRTSYLLIALGAAATAVVVIRMAQTWS